MAVYVDDARHRLGAPPAAEAIEAVPATSRSCGDCYEKPPEILEAFFERGIKYQRVRCRGCGRVRRRHFVGGAE